MTQRLTQQELSQRKQLAVAAGVKRYHGNLCERHPQLLGLRVTWNGLCYECSKISARKRTAKWLAHNRSKQRLREKQNRDRRRETIRRTERERYAANRQRYLDKHKRWRRKPDVAARLREKAELWRQQSLSRKCSNQSRRKARQICSALSSSNADEIETIYLRARELTISTGVRHEVGHVVPLLAKDICGLHVPCNLQILPEKENRSKHNKWTEADAIPVALQGRHRLTKECRMITTIRASSLPSFSDCPRRWGARTLGKEIAAAGYDIARSMPPSIGASVGTATHGGAAFIMAEKMKSGELGNEADAEQKALEDLDTAAKTGVLWDDATPNTNDAQKQVLRMVKVFRNTIAVQIQPIAVERRLEARVGEGFVLSGQSDMQTLEPGRIRDLKTGRFPRVHHAQLGAYSLLARTAHPEQPTSEVCVDFIQRVALKNPQPSTKTDFYDQAVAEQAAVSTITRIQQDVTEFRRRIEDGGAPPEHSFLANPGSMLCAQRWCPAHSTSFCREHKR